MLLPRALLVPHWPPLLEDELRRHRTPMLDALASEARRFAAERPAIAVVLSARWESSGPFHVGQARYHRTLTDDPVFGVESRYDCAGHPELARALVEAGTRAGVRVGPSDRGVDGGVTVPMHFLAPGRGLRVVPLSIAKRPVEECRRWGAAIRGVLEGRPERIGLVVGGMLSHGTHAWNFRRDVPEAAQLDQAVMEGLRAGDWAAIGSAVDKWKAKAHPEAGLLHLEVLRGFLGEDLAGEVRCYESGPGMGAALVAFPVPGAISVATPEDLAEPVVVRAERPARTERPARRAAPGRRERMKKRAALPVGAGAAPQRRMAPKDARRGRFGKFGSGTIGSGRAGGGRPASGRPSSGKFSSDRPSSGKFSGGRPSSGRPSSRKFSSGRPASGRFGGDRPTSGPSGNGRPKGRRPSAGASAGSRTPRTRGRAPTPRPARKPRG